MGLKLSTLYNLALLSLLAAVTGLILSRSAHAAVGLVYFTGDEDQGDVILEWETAYEDGTAGFRIRRSDNPNTDLNVLYNNAKTTFIPTESDESGFGGTYTAIDDTAQAGQSYVYTLYEVTTGNQTNELETTDQITISQGGNNTLPTNTPAPTQSGVGPTATSTTPTPQTTSTTAAGNGTPTTAPQVTATANLQATATLAPVTPTADPFTNAPATVDISDEGNFEQVEEPPVESSTEEEPIVIAEVNAQEEQPYPAPVDEGVDTEAPDTNAPQQVATEAAYVDPNTNSQQTTQSIGADAQPEMEIAGGSSAAEESSSSTLLLWIGFMGALLIFGGGIIGSLLIFMRRRE